MRVMVGGCTCSMAASSPSVGLPSAGLTAPSAEAWAGDRPAERLLAEAPLQPVDGDAEAAGHLLVGWSAGRARWRIGPSIVS